MKSFLQASGFLGTQSAEELAGTYETPLYVYNEGILRDRMRAVSKLITKYPFTANYSMKANSNPSILRIALEEGLNCDAMSVGEVKLLLHVGFPKERIFFVPNNVSKDELQFAIDQGIIVSVDSIDQLETFGTLNPGGSVSVRLNPGVGAGHHEKVVTAGKNTKFGIAAEDIPLMREVAERYQLKIIGINQHVGSLFMEGTPYLKAVQNLLDEARNYPDLELIDFGGGFGIPYHKLNGEEKFDMEALHDALEPVLDDFVAAYGRAPLFKMEPGRFCVAEGGILLGRVYSRKQNAGKRYVGTDIGMNILARPTLYDSWHDIEILREGQVITEGTTECVTVVGNICETGDILAKDRELPVIEDGDLVCVLDAGAYGYSMSSNYNTRPRPAEVMIREDGTAKLIRRRDTFEDLLRQFT